MADSGWTKALTGKDETRTRTISVKMRSELDCPAEKTSNCQSGSCNNYHLVAVRDALQAYSDTNDPVSNELTEECFAVTDQKRPAEPTAFAVAVFGADVISRGVAENALDTISWNDGTDVCFREMIKTVLRTAKQNNPKADIWILGDD